MREGEERIGGLFVVAVIRQRVLGTEGEDGAEVVLDRGEGESRRKLIIVCKEEPRSKRG